MMRACSALRGSLLKMSFRQDLQNLQDPNYREHPLGIWGRFAPGYSSGIYFAILLIL